MERKELQIIDERELLGKHFVIYGTKEEPLFKAKDVAEWIGYCDANAMVRNIDEDEKLNLQLVGAGQRREYIMLTEDEKVRYIIPTLGGMQRNKYVWRILL